MQPRNVSASYVCPRCHGSLEGRDGGYRCHACDEVFPCNRDIPDFLLEKPTESADPFLRDVEEFGRLATIYETPLWFPIMLRLLGGWRASTLGELVSFARGFMANVQGSVLDVATGTGTYGRHVAASERQVYGIDVSFHMLRKGRAFAAKEGIEDMRFARADANALPFADAAFSGCLLCGAIHIFPDTLAAMTEIARTLKPGAPLWVTTVVWGESGLLSHAWVRRRMQGNQKMRVFAEEELRNLLGEAGFERIGIVTQGCLASVTASKC